MKKVKCAVCGKEEMVYPSRVNRYKTCSKKCMGQLFSINLSTNTTKKCPICETEFKIKPSQGTRRKYCSKVCQARAYQTRYLGDNNPHYKGTTHDTDGYINGVVHGKRVKLHIAVVLEVLMISSIPFGYHVHHRDCDKANCTPENLVVLKTSDHVWLHKNFGNVVLWAMMNRKISAEDIASWSRDANRAIKLLTLSILDQIGVFKSGELLENPEEDNQQPSRGLTSLEGSTTRY